MEGEPWEHSAARGATRVLFRGEGRQTRPVDLLQQPPADAPPRGPPGPAAPPRLRLRLSAVGTLCHPERRAPVLPLGYDVGGAALAKLKLAHGVPVAGQPQPP